MTIYFSRVGNTDFSLDVDAVSGASVMKDHNNIIGNAQMIAMMVNNTVGGEIFEIQTINKYPASYSETVTVGKNELNSNEYPTLKAPLPDLSDIDIVVLVYPLWWSTLPRAVEGFLKDCDLSDKTLIPIVTHGGGGIGDSIEVMKRSTNARFITNPLDIYSSDIPAARGTIYNYLDSLRLK